MRRAIAVILGAAAIVAAVVLLTGSLSSDEQGSDERAGQEALRRHAVAQACMSPSDLRRYQVVSARLGRRFGRLLNNDETATKEALDTDAQLRRLSRRQQALVAAHSPGGSKYESRCYRFGVEKFDLDGLSGDLDEPIAVTLAWAQRHRRPGEEVPERGCGVDNRSQYPVVYRCKVTFRDDTGRYRGYDPRRYRGYNLRLHESVPGQVRIVSVSRRPAGPRAYE